MRSPLGAILLVVGVSALLWWSSRSRPLEIPYSASSPPVLTLVDPVLHDDGNRTIRLHRAMGNNKTILVGAATTRFAAVDSRQIDATTPPLLSLLSKIANPKNATSTSARAAELIHGAFPGTYGWVFLRYVPSKLEDDYYSAVLPYDRSNMSWDKLRPAFGARFEAMHHAMRSRVVPHAPLTSTEVFRTQCLSYVQRTNTGGREAIPANEEGCLADTSQMDSELFSRFEYKFVCLSPPCPPQAEADDDNVPVADRGSGRKKTYRVGDIHTSYIESLGGSMRHPKVFINEVTNSLRRIDWNYLFRKDYMIVDKWALNNLYHRWALPKKTSHLLDLGSSTFSQGTGGASQPWFFGLADCMCVPFTTSRFWEATEHRADGVWLDVPKERRPRYHWYNYPLSADDDSWRNPLNHLLSTAAVGDVGIVKVDFEAPILEARIIERIIELPELHLLIDELFFEHHVRNGPMQNLWQQIITKDCGCRCTMDLFRRLRHVGVRAHSWV